MSDSITFLVNTTFRFPTLLLSPNNSTYNSKEIPLTYTIDDSKYLVYYELDNSRQTRLTGNTTLSGLSEGQHTIRAFAADFMTDTGIYSKQTANFTIDTINPTPTVPEFSWVAVLPLLASVLLVTVATKRFKRLST